MNEPTSANSYAHLGTAKVGLVVTGFCEQCSGPVSSHDARPEFTYLDRAFHPVGRPHEVAHSEAHRRKPNFNC